MAIVQNSDKGYAIIGRTTSVGAGGQDVWFIKTNTVGTLLWNKTYGGTGTDGAPALMQTTDGGFAFPANTNSFGAGGQDAWFVKTDSNGTIQWSKTFGGTSNEYAQYAIQTSDGGYAITGSTITWGTANTEDVWIIKTDASGNMIWNKIWGGSGNDSGFSMIQAADGSFVIEAQ